MEDEATGADATVVAGREPTGATREARPAGGRVLGGRYRVQAMLGAGGMGSVFLALDAELGERVAVKMLKPELVSDAVMLERFRSEVRLARRVTHKNVARTYDIGEDGQERFLTMEYIEGESLAQRLRRVGTLPFAFLLSVAEGIASGLSAAHEAGVVHRDLKPQNVMLGRDGRVVLTDFGVAVARGEGAQDDVAGTPAYMAPEQLAGEAVDERADVFAFGVVLFRMATGRSPIGADARAIHTDPCELRPGLPAAFGALVRRCLEADRTKRFASAAEVRRALAVVPVVEDDAPATLPASLAIVRQLDIAGQRLIVVSPVVADVSLASMATWLTTELELTFGRSPVVRTTTIDDARAEVVLATTLEAEGDHLRGHVTIRTVVDGSVFWEGEVAVSTVEVPKLPDAIAGVVESALAVDVASATDLPPLPRASVASYIKARSALESSFAADAAEALALLTSATGPAPDHPLLLSAIAYATSRTSFWRGELLASARQLSERAVASAPRLPESHLALANVGWQETNLVAMARALRTALSLAPGHPHARHMLAQLLLEAGAPVDAQRLLEDALSRAPGIHRARIDMAHGFALRGLYDRARQTLDAIPEAHPESSSSFVWRCRHHLWRREGDGVRRLVSASAEHTKSPLMKAFRELFAAVLDGLPVRLFPESPVFDTGASAVPRRRALSAQFSAEADAYNGHWDDVLANLERSVSFGLQDVFWFDRCPLLDDLRGSRRFEALRSVVRERAEAALRAFEED